MAAKTLESRVNTESFSHVSGSVPYFWLCGSPKPPLFPTQVGVFLKYFVNASFGSTFSHVSGSVPWTTSVGRSSSELLFLLFSYSY